MFTVKFWCLCHFVSYFFLDISAHNKNPEKKLERRKQTKYDNIRPVSKLVAEAATRRWSSK